MEVPLVVNDFLRRAVKLYPGQEAVVNGSCASPTPSSARG